MIKSYEIDGNLYPEEKIKEAIGDFEEVATIQFNKNTLGIEAESNEEAEEVFCELMNYTLSLINE